MTNLGSVVASRLASNLRFLDRRLEPHQIATATGTRTLHPSL
jgi:hypothetical protein